MTTLYAPGQPFLGNIVFISSTVLDDNAACRRRRLSHAASRRKAYRRFARLFIALVDISVYSRSGRAAFCGSSPPRTGSHSRFNSHACPDIVRQVSFG